MNRSWAIMIAAMLLASCRSSQPTTNPFLRTTVAPPATGQAVVVVPTEPYSTTPPIITTPPPPGAVPVTPVQGAPMAAPMAPAVPRGGDKYSPPGGSYIFHQSKNERPKKASPDDDVVLASASEPISTTGGPPATTLKLTAADPQAQPQADAQVLKLAASPPNSAAAAQGDDAQSRGHPLTLADAADSANNLRIVGESSATTASGNTNATFRATQTAAANSPVLKITAGEPAAVSMPAFRDVTPQPAVARVTASAGPNPTANTAQFVTAPVAAASSGVVQTAFQPAAVSATVSAPGSLYAHRADYSELRGRLEYSQTARQWKLRYIPIDGETDQYGGSLVLAESPLLASYKSGDQVLVRGTLSSAGTSAGGTAPQAGFAPTYQAQQIERLGG